jgi:hypothetical protein
MRTWIIDRRPSKPRKRTQPEARPQLQLELPTEREASRPDHEREAVESDRGVAIVDFYI